MNKKILILTVAVTLIICVFFILSDKKEDTLSYKLGSYKNTVALYENDQPIEIYDSIVLTSLPETDRRKFDKGIVINSKAEATKIIEDYDG